MAGAFSFRGKAIQYSDLLSPELQNESFADMDPVQMADYAGRIEQEGGANFAYRLGRLVSQLHKDGLPLPPVPDFDDRIVVRQFCELVREKRTERMQDQGFDPEGWPFDTNAAGEAFKWRPLEELTEQLLTVMDGARWLRFWGDLGHSMHAWY